jgi:hypothetical protein
MSTSSKKNQKLNRNVKQVSVSDYGKFLTLLNREPNQLRKKLLFTGYLFNQLEKEGVETYLVGGQAVEFYTGGQFETGDIDITVTNREKAETILSRLGFAREGMIWLNQPLNMAVQIVGSYPLTTAKVRSVKAKRFTIRTVGVEDLIVDRLVAAKFWQSNPKLDSEEAAVLLDMYKKDIDMDYLRKKASEQKVEDYLKLIEKTSIA